jgi:Tfp pilus assembly protein PilN
MRKPNIAGLDIAEFKGKRVNLAIHAEDLLLHIITIPKAKDEEIQSILEGKVNQYVAFAGVKTVIGWEKLGEVAEAGERKLRILLAVAKRALVDSHIAAVEKAGLSIEAITFPCLAVLDLLKKSSLKSGPRENKIFVDLDGQQTFIMFLKGGAIHFVHQGRFEGLSGDLKKILQQGEKVSSIVLHSQTQPADNLIEKLNAELGQTVILELNMTAKGLAQLKRPKINLLPWEVKQAEEWREQITYFLFSVVGLSLFMIALFFLFYLGGFILDRQIAAVQAELDKPTEQFVQLKEIEDKTNEIKELLVGRQRILEKHQGFPWDDVFAELTELVPANVYLTRVEADQEEAVIISGVAGSSDYIFDFVRKLKEAKHFKNADLKVVREAEEASGMTEFSIYTEKK